MELHPRSLLVGRRPDLTRRYLLVGVVVSIVWSGYLRSDVILVLPLWVLGLIFVGLPAVQAYQNEGLLVSISLGLFMALGFYLPLTVFNLASPGPDLLGAVGSSLLFGVPAGLLGFSIGVGLDRLRDHLNDAPGGSSRPG